MAYVVTLLLLVTGAAVVGMGLNLQWGLAGLINFGVVGFVAVGAYATALAAPHLGWGAAMAFSIALCALLSGGLALLSIRLSDDYLAIVTLGFGEIVRLLLLNESWLTGGALGIADVRRPLAPFVSPAASDAAQLAFATVATLAVLGLLELLARSPFGRALRAVRDDPIAAAAVGKDVFVLRLKAFAVGGAVMGVAGALHAFYITYIDPSQFTPIVTAYAFMAVIAGGRGSNAGLLLGVGAITLLLEATRFLKDAIPWLDGAQLAALRLGGVGVGIVLLLILAPGGLLREPLQRSSNLFPETK